MSKLLIKEEIDKESVLLDRLNSLSIISKGIEHDLSNVLTILKGNISLAKLLIDDPHRSFDILNEAESACDRVKDIVQQFSVFSDDSTPKKKKVLIQDLLEITAKFCLRARKIECKFSFPHSNLYIKANEAHLYQIFANLIINASQSIPVSGTILIKVNSVFIDEYGKVPLKRGEYVKVSIIDNGCGIPENKLSKIFDINYSTKKNGKGIGLAITKSLVEKLDGFITVESQIGMGTTFHVYLPLYT